MMKWPSAPVVIVELTHPTGEGVEAGLVIRKTDDPARPPARLAILESRRWPLRHPLDRAGAAQHRHGPATAHEQLGTLVRDRLERFLRHEGVGERDVLGLEIEVEDRERAILMHPRERPAAAPIGRARETALDQLARMVDPELRFRQIAQAGVQDRFLVAPLPRPVGSDAAHGVVPGLVVIERRQPALALAEAPFEPARPVPEGQLLQLRARPQPMIAQAQGELRQGVRLLAVPASAPQEARHAGELERPHGAQAVLVAAPLRSRQHPLVAG